MFLKLVRILIAALTFLSFLVILYLPLNNSLIEFSNIFLLSQIGPLVIKLISNFTLVYLFFFLIIVILTIITGRFYCSFLCPTGIIQDIFALLRVKKRYKYLKSIPINTIILFFSLFFTIIGILSILSLLEPYSIFTRINSEIIKPFFSIILNAVVKILVKNKIYLSYNFTFHKINFFIFFITLITLFFLFITSTFMGRFYCNYICPVGTVLSYISKFSLLKITINKNKCTLCKKCEQKCKANCINLKTKSVDNSRCVLCFNCISACSFNAISYTKTKIKEVDIDRRNFLLLFLLIPASLLRNKSKNYLNNIFTKKNIILPPGAVNIMRYTEKCIQCNLCVNCCPTKVLRPMAFENNILLQPNLDFRYSFCEYECNICSQLCPTGAITNLSLKQKKLIQIGVIHLTKEYCISWKKELDCGACAEHCPTKAVYMIPYKNLFAPETNENLCIGCGACEFVCPSKPKSIKIIGNKVQKILNV